MKKKMSSSLFVLLLFLSNFVGFVKPLIVQSETTFDASQFVESVSLANGDGPIGSNKISDSSSVNVTYNLTIGDGSTIDITSAYTMPVPSELKYSTTTPIELFTAAGQKLGEVTIVNGVASIYFEEIVTTLKNVTLYFNFWSGFNKDSLDYDNGNDLVFPTKNNPNNAIHVNFSKSSSGGGSGTSAISKNLTYGENNIVNWTVTINNGGYEVEKSQFVDTMENTQNYVPGSTTINYRNWSRSVLYTETTDLNFNDNGDGSKTSMLNFGYLTSAESKNSTAVTSIVIRYQTRLIYNKDNNRYPNRAYSNDGSELIDDVVSTATYRGQGGGGSGDETIDIAGEKQWDDYENKFQTRPEIITVELLQNNQVIEEQEIQASEANQWNYAFLDQLKYDETGTEYNYSVREKEVPAGYTSEVVGTTIINHYQNTETLDILGEKQWDDYENKFHTRPESITVELLQNDQVIEEQEIQADRTDQWNYAFLDQLKYDETGTEYIYSVREKEVPTGYTTEIVGTTIINHYQNAETLDITGEKQWDDYENKFHTRPENITVELLQNDQVIEEQEIQADSTGQWNYVFQDQLKYDKIGTEYHYTVREKEVPLGYTVKIDNYTIINTLDPSKSTSDNLTKTPSTPKKEFLPKAGEKTSILFLLVGLCEVGLIFLLSYLLKYRHQHV